MVGWAAGWTRGGVLAGCTALKNAGTKAGIAALKGRSTAAAASGGYQLVRAGYGVTWGQNVGRENL